MHKLYICPAPMAGADARCEAYISGGKATQLCSSCGGHSTLGSPNLVCMHVLGMQDVLVLHDLGCPGPLTVVATIGSAAVRPGTLPAFLVTGRDPRGSVATSLRQSRHCFHAASRETRECLCLSGITSDPHHGATECGIRRGGAVCDPQIGGLAVLTPFVDTRLVRPAWSCQATN